MQRFITRFFAAALVLAVLTASAVHRDAGAAAPGDGGISSSSCGQMSAGAPAGRDERPAPGAGTEELILLACEFQKPLKGCKKNPCDGKTYCCSSGKCYTK